VSSKAVFQSPNFQFLEKVDPLLVELGARAECYSLDDPNTSMIKSRQLGELLAQIIASKNGIRTKFKPFSTLFVWTVTTPTMR